MRPNHVIQCGGLDRVTLAVGSTGTTPELCPPMLVVASRRLTDGGVGLETTDSGTPAASI